MLCDVWWQWRAPENVWAVAIVDNENSAKTLWNCEFAAIHLGGSTIITSKSSIHRHHKCDACLPLCLLSFRHLLFRICLLCSCLRCLPRAKNGTKATYLVSVGLLPAVFLARSCDYCSFNQHRFTLTESGSNFSLRFVSLRVLCICFCASVSLAVHCFAIPRRTNRFQYMDETRVSFHTIFFLGSRLSTSFAVVVVRRVCCFSANEPFSAL